MEATHSWATPARATPPGARKYSRPASTASAGELGRVLSELPLDGIVVTDSAGRVSHVNNTVERATGWSNAEARGRPVAEVIELLDETALALLPCPVARVLADSREVRFGAAWLISRDGWRTPVRGIAAPLHTQDENLSGVVLVFHDLTELRQLERHVSYHSYHDPLTGLPNRLAFEHALAQAESVGEARAHALLYVDLDNFALLNQTVGRQAGDDLLRAMAELLEYKAEGGHLVARLGGDEFGVLLEDRSREEAAQLAREIVAEAEAFWRARRVQADGVGLCVGVATLTSRAASPALIAAQAACETAKAQGRNRVSVWPSDDGGATERQVAMHWVPRISAARRDDRFFFRVQEIRPLAPRAAHPHYEVLLRMSDERGREVMPSEFIPVAERYGLMPELDRWIIHCVFEALARGRSERRTLPDDTYCINLSGTSLGDPGLLDYVCDELARVQLPAQSICFEITETSAVANLREAAILTRSLKAHGFKLALDDFGSGLSSFAYLKSLTVDYLKIEGSFVRDIASSRESRAIVEAINGVGHALGLRTIAECVENRRDLVALREIGVDFVQGFGIARPRRMAV